MACTTITDYLVRETGRYLPDEIFTRTFGVAPWPTIMPRGEFPKGLGETINVLTYERMAPTVADPTWTDVLVADGSEGGACLQPAEKIPVGSTTRSFNLKRLILEGPDFCAEEIRSPFEVMQQLEAITGILVDYSTKHWEIRDRHEYFRMVKYKVVVDNIPSAATSSSTQASVYPSSCPTSIMYMAMLQYWGLRLRRDGALGMGKENGTKVLTWICSAEASDDLIFRNPDIRQDLRWAEPSALLKALGVERSYRGFFHLIDEYPRRFTCALPGPPVEVAAFTTLSATKGTKAELNSSWLNATAEESFIFEPTVMRQLIPRPITNPAPNFRFDPVNYMGVWTLKNIPDRTCNPDGNIIFHRGILAAGSMPVHPERGVAFVHNVCGPTSGQVISCGS